VFKQDSCYLFLLQVTALFLVYCKFDWVGQSAIGTQSTNDLVQEWY